MPDPARWTSECLDQIEPCTKLYHDFEQGAEFIKAVFSVLDNYKLDDTEKEAISYARVMNEKKPYELFKDNISLGLLPEYDGGQFTDLYKKLIDAVSQFSPDLYVVMNESRKIIDSAIIGETGRWQRPKALINEVREKVIKETGLGEDMATFLFSLCEAFIIRRKYKNILSSLDTSLYEGGECPVCATKPHFGQLRSLDGAKEMECWLCGTRWVHQRVKCPYCGNDEREDLGYFTLENSEICRIHYCNSCNSYCKIIDARKIGAERSLMLTVHNLATLMYDSLAIKEGFSPGSGLLWVNADEF